MKKGEEQRVLPFDYVVIATGKGKLAPPSPAPPSPESPSPESPSPSLSPSPSPSPSSSPLNEIDFFDYDSALSLRSRLPSLLSLPSPTVVVTGGGYVGVELAASLAAKAPKSTVHLVARSGLLKGSRSAYNRAQAAEALRNAGVVVHTFATVASKTPSTSDANLSSVSLSTGLTLPSVSLVLNTAFPSPPPLSTTSTLRLPSLSSAYAVGDAGQPSPEGYPSDAQSAIATGKAAAYNIYSAMTGAKPLAYSHVDLGEIMTFGEGGATVSSLEGRVKLEGGAARKAREALYKARMPGAFRAFMNKKKAARKGGKKEEVNKAVK